MFNFYFSTSFIICSTNIYHCFYFQIGDITDQIAAPSNNKFNLQLLLKLTEKQVRKGFQSMVQLNLLDSME